MSRMSFGLTSPNGKGFTLIAFCGLQFWIIRIVVISTPASLTSVPFDTWKYVPYIARTFPIASCSSFARTFQLTSFVKLSK